LTNSGNGWTENLIESFTDDQDSQGVQDGSYPFGSLLFNSSSQIFYGANANAYPTSGTNYGGSVFQVSSSGFSVIGSGLPGPVEQVSGPHSGFIIDSQGNLYGTTYGEITTNGTPTFGTVFELTAASNYATLKTLYTFMGEGTDGAFPIGDLLLDSSGNLYGTTYSGFVGECSAPLGCGSVFKLCPPGNTCE
jgi:hypothetical protein